MLQHDLQQDVSEGYRYVPMFGEVDFQPANAYSSVPLEEQIEALAEAVSAGKVRQIGASNETAWGVTKLCQLGKQKPNSLLLLLLLCAC